FASLTCTRAGTPDFARAPTGSTGAWASTWAPRASGSVWLGPSGPCRSWPRRWRRAISRTPRSGRSRGWPRPRPRRGCWPSGAPAPRTTSSASCAAGAEWTARPRLPRPSNSTCIARYTCIKTKTVWWWSADGWRPRSAPCSSRPSPRPARRCISRLARRVAETGLVIDSVETPPMEQQRADALGLLAETALHHGIDPGAPGERYQVVVHVDAPVLADPDQPGQAVLEDGGRVSAETSQRLAIDASRVVMQHGLDGRVVEVSARARTIPPALRRALHHRDRGCGVRFGHGHHIRHWAQGGPTTLSNLALLCRRHHRAVHEDGYQLAR